MSEQTLLEFQQPRKRKHVAVGLQFSRLTVISFSHRVTTASGGQLNYWNCHCECGGKTEVTNRNLLSGHTKSCGCFCRERNRDVHTIHGFARQGNVHKIHKVWRNMLARCENKNNTKYLHYGGRGIRVCKRWHTFLNFAADMFSTWREGLTIERMNNDGDYKPGNCKWATRTEQSLNRRSNVIVTAKGMALTVSQWSDKLDISEAVIHKRIARGCPADDCIATINFHTNKPLKGDTNVRSLKI